MTDNQKTIFLRKVLTSEEILHMKIKYVPLLLLPIIIFRAEYYVLTKLFSL